MPAVRSWSLRSSLSVVLAVAGAAVVVAVLSAPALAEQPVAGDTVVGELVQGYADPFPSTEAGEPAASEPVGHDDVLSWIRPARGAAVRVPTDDIEDVAVGSRVQVVLGDAVADEVAATDLAPAQEVLDVEVLSAPAEGTAAAGGPVNHEVTVVMLQPAGVARDATTLAQVVDAVNGPVAAFWAGQTDDAVRVGVVASYDWGAASSSTCSTPFQLWSDAATRAGWQSAPGRHLLVYVPAGSSGCAYGLGTVGGGIGSGGMAYTQDADLAVIAHELGHNMGLGHASELLCDGTMDRNPCVVSSYDDYYDVMGTSWGPVGSLGAPHAARLGVLPGGAVRTVAAGAPPLQYALAPIGTRSGTRALRLVDGSGQVYWVEYRTATGQDGWLTTPDNWLHLQEGVQVRLAATGQDTSLLLDGTPSRSATWGQDGLVSLPGLARVSFGAGPFTVTLLENRPGFARVEVSTNGPSALTRIESRYMALGGMAGSLGVPLEHETCALPGGGCRRAYQNGSLYYDPWAGRVSLMSPATAARYEAAGGPAGLGYPVDDERAVTAPGGTGRITSFPGGDVVWTPSTGARLVRGAILAHWRAVGAQTGPLGYPTGDDVPVGDGRGYMTSFAGGNVYWSAATGAHMVRGAILGQYLALDGPAVLGYPLADDGGAAGGGGALVRLEGGDVYWSPATGAHVVRGALLLRWRQLGGQLGPLGYPVGDDEPAAGGQGYQTRFAGGTLFWSPTTGAQMVRGAILQKYVAAGGPAVLGYPVADDGGTADGSGALVRLQGGDVYWSPATGARVVRGAILAHWRAVGAQSGPLGYPTGDDVPVGDGRGYMTSFAGGNVYWSAATGAHMVRGAILGQYLALGGPAVLGYPLDDDGGAAGGGGALVRLEGGDVYWSPATGAHVVRGALLARWRQLGGQLGPLGYPVGDDEPAAGGQGYQTRFAGGTLFWSPVTGTRMVRGALLQQYLALGGPAVLGFPTTDDQATSTRDGAYVLVGSGGLWWSPATGAHHVRAATAGAWAQSGAQGGPLGYPTGDSVARTGGGWDTAFQHGSLYEAAGGSVTQVP